jgi:hypothetical protein
MAFKIFSDLPRCREEYFVGRKIDLQLLTVLAIGQWQSN